ncbi:MAG: Cof-type HAD-IIB family hydrolase [Flavobacteriaceae bacterium]
MNYKVLCSDLDGTLLTTKSDVSDFTIAEIYRIKKAVKVILVSARMPKAISYLQQRMKIENEPIICYNGALIMKGSLEISSTLVGMNFIKEIHRLTEAHSIKLGLYHKDEWYVEERTERVQKEIRYTQNTPVFRDTSKTIEDWEHRGIGAHKIMLMGNKSSTDAISPKLQKMFSTDLHLYRSNDTLIEIAPKSVSKLSAIKLLIDKEYTLNDVIAFGDNYNDIEMLKHTGCGVAVANGRDQVKAIADYITLPNTEDGVAHFIRQHILI